MSARDFARLLAPLAALVFIGGWAAGIAAFFIIGAENCATVDLGIAGEASACQQTNADATVLMIVVGFASTVSSLLLLSLRYLIVLLADIADNTRRG